MVTDADVTTWSGRTQESKNKDIIHAKDFGLMGDGTDEWSKLTNLFNSGARIIQFEKDKIYGSSKQIEIPSNISIYTSGSIFKKLFANTLHLFKINKYVNFDHLKIYLSVKSNINRGIKIIGSHVSFDSIDIYSDTDSFDSTGIWAVEIESEDSTFLESIRINYLKTYQTSCALLAKKVRNIIVNGGLTEKYRVGYYLRDVSFSSFSNIIIRYTSQSSNGSPGENGFLIERTDPNTNTSNLEFNNCVVEDSGEHGYRLGGSLTIKHVIFNHCVARRTGSAIKINNPSSTEWHGGCGFKILGATSVLNQKHSHIQFNNCIVEDVNGLYGVYPDGHGVNNFSAFQIGVADYIYLNECYVSATDNVEYSCPYPCEVLASTNLFISNCTFRDAKSYFRIYQATEDENIGWHLPSQNIFVTNTSFFAKDSTLNFHIYIGQYNKGYEYKNIRFIDCYFNDTDRLIRLETAIDDTKYDIKITGIYDRSDAAILAPVSGEIKNLFLDIETRWVGALNGFISRLGSRIQDPQNNMIYTFRDGRWFPDFTVFRFTIEVETSISFSYIKTIGVINIIGQNQTLFGQIFYRTGTPYAAKMSGSNNLEARSTALNGTTGNDGKVTLGVDNTKIYIENRLTGSLTVEITFAA